MKTTFTFTFEEFRQLCKNKFDDDVHGTTVNLTIDKMPLKEQAESMISLLMKITELPKT